MQKADLLKDEWIEKRENRKDELLECQKERALKSCFACDELIGCKIRKAYVTSVYESMNKGARGGFEF